MSGFPTALIADDEPVLRHHLNKMLAETWPQLSIVSAVGDGESALKEIESLQPDIVFLDIRMPGIDGMTLAKKLNKIPIVPKIVFVTAYDEYAVSAFEQNAVDYLLKPITEDRLAKACFRLKQNIKNEQEEEKVKLSNVLAQLQRLESSEEPQFLKWIRASRGEDIHLISTLDVLYFKAEDKYISVFANQAGTVSEYLIRTSLKELMHKLDPDQFWQVHRSTVIRVSAIEKVQKSLSGQMSVSVNGVKLAVSRSAQALFKPF